ncbi:methyltransferase [Paraconexibacter sp.]|uniref:methyltransferase n=1 Tax=Paraconexibacter sp. TaxID=2949640 RepID=UPI003566D4AC
MSATQLNPGHILQVGMGFWASRTVLSATELGVFTELGEDALSGEELRERLDLAPRAVPDFPDALVALGFLDAEGNGPDRRYRNTPETAMFLHRDRPTYVGGMLEMCSDRLYGFWGDLTEALRTGEPQNEIKRTGRPMFVELYDDPDRLEQFMHAMQGISLGPAHALAGAFDFSRYETVLDVGGATGLLSTVLAEHHPHLRCTSWDLPVVQPIADRFIASTAVADRVSTAAGDFFEDALPQADVLTMGLILHDWNLEKKKHLIAAAFDALPDGGALIVIEALIDDARREHAFGLLMSLNMLIEFGDAFDYSGADFDGWCRGAGFRETEVLDLPGEMSAAVAYK